MPSLPSAAHVAAHLFAVPAAEPAELGRSRRRVVKPVN